MKMSTSKKKSNIPWKGALNNHLVNILSKEYSKFVAPPSGQSKKSTCAGWVGYWALVVRILPAKGEAKRGYCNLERDRSLIAHTEVMKDCMVLNNSANHLTICSEHWFICDCRARASREYSNICRKYARTRCFALIRGIVQLE
jgi:hypothetical protein